MIWILLTFIASIFQTFLNIEQKKLSQKLDALTTSWSRFILPFPFAVIASYLSLNNISTDFCFFVFFYAIFQIIGNSFLVKTFQSKNFSIGIAFYKTEALQTAIVGILIFNQKISLIAIIGIIFATIGVIMILNLKFKNGKKEFLKSLKSSSIIYGLLSGFFLSISGFNLKFATIELINYNFNYVESALITLIWAILIQNFLFIAIKFSQKSLKKDLRKIFNVENKKTFLKAGLFSFCGSICWFCAYSFGEVILIKTLSQIELIFALLVSHFMLREKNSFMQIIGIFLITIGIIITIYSNS